MELRQLLIVEGINDLHAIQSLIDKRGIKLKFNHENYIRSAGDVDRAINLFGQALNNPSIQNVGIVIDANSIGIYKRLNKLKAFLKNNLPKERFDKLQIQKGGIVVVEENMPIIGIWFMPDNESKGYLEHFLAKMIPVENELWQHVLKTVDELSQKDFCEFKEKEKQKALIHTWLAWQKSPGLPFGTAVKSGYFDVNSPSVEPFLKWFENTFLLT